MAPLQPANATDSASTTYPDQAHGSTLNSATLAGICIGGVAFALIVFVVIAWAVSRLRNRRAGHESEQAERGVNIGAPTRFGTAEHDFAPGSFPERRPAEKRGVQPPFRQYPTVDTSMIGLAVTSDPAQASGKTPPDRTPVSATSSKSTTRLLPQPPQANLKGAVPRSSVQRRRHESAATIIEDIHDHFGQTGQPPRPLTASTNVIRPVSNEIAELPCNSPRGPVQQSASAPANKVGKESPQIVPVIKRQAAGRESTQTLISPEPMSPTATKPDLLAIPITPGSAAYDPARGYIPSYYYNDSLTPHQPAFPSPLHQTNFPGSVKDAPETPVPRFKPQTPPHHGSLTSRSPGSGATTLVNSNSPPPRPRRNTPPPLPPPPAFKPGIGPPDDKYSRLRSKYSIPPSDAGADSAPSSVARHQWQATAQTRTRDVRDSTASLTSVETTFEEQESPPENEETTKRLSPVPEAVLSAASLQYPKVPPPSNQAVLRTTPSPPSKELQHERERSLSRETSRSHSSSPTPTLVAKRKGSNAEDEMKRGLWITGSNGRTSNEPGHFPAHTSSPQPQPAGRGRGQFQRPRQQEMVMKSPIWEPNLTPKRTPKGDLVLEVTNYD